MGERGMLEACKEGRIEKVREFLRVNPGLVKTTDKHGYSTLHYASKKGHFDVTKLLVESKATIDAKNKFGFTPLHCASYSGYIEIVKLLIDSNAMIDARNEDGNTPLYYASCYGFVDIVRLLVGLEATIDAQDKDGYTPLYYASRNGHTEIARILVESQATIDLHDKTGSTPLHKASENGHIEIVKLLVESKARIDVKDNYGNVPLHYASKNGHIETTKLLIKSKAAINAQNENGYAPLHYASENNHIETAKLLVESGAKVDLENKYEKTPLHSATYNGNIGIEKILVKQLVKKSGGQKLLDLLRDATKMLEGVSFSSSNVKIPPSPLINNKFVDQFPWRSSMAKTLTHLDLSNCGLTELPKGFCCLDEHKVVKINLEGNPFSDVIVDAVVREGSAKDIILMAKELKGGGMELKEKKVLVVGDAAVGKTTLLRGLRGENEVGAKVATDGIEIGELRLEGVVLNCWDFAGQEVYRYTHQLFMSDDSIYIVLFNLSHSIPSICSQLTYWFDSISHRAQDSEIILVGTHASVVPNRKKKQVKKQVVEKFGGYVKRDVLVVDSLNGDGLENMKNALSEVALQNLPRVPRLFEEIRQSFQQYRDSGKGSHFVEMNQLKQDVGNTKTLKNLTDESWEWCLRVLNCVGGIVLVDWDSYAGNKRFRSTFVIVRPSWLVDMFKTVVTMRHNFVKDGIISIEGLRKCWKEYDSSMHDLLLEALEKFDVVCRLSGDKVIVPCLLPDCPPDDFLGWTQNGERASRCLRTNENIARFSTFRRSFLKIRKSQKRENRSLPVGVMGKVLCSMFQWGKVRYAWKTGCVVVCGDTENKIVAMMWEGDCGGRAGVHFVFCGDASPSPSSSLGSSSSLDKSCASVRRLLQQASQLMKNLFEDFYNVDYEAVVPCSVDQQGVPVTWVNVNDILGSLYQSNSKVSVVTRDGEVAEQIAVGGLAPDLVLDEDCVRFFDEDKIVLGQLLGNGSYGEVFRGEISWENDMEESLKEGKEEGDEERNEGKGKGKEKEGEGVEKERQLITKKVAVKKILLDKALEKGDNQEDILKGLHHETYLSLQVRHPNVVQMVGMCSQTSPPLLLLELLDGDLFSSLTDPLSLEPTFEEFFKMLGLIVQGKKSWNECCCLFEKLRSDLRSPANVQQIGERLISSAVEYINDPTIAKHGIVEDSLESIREAYKRALEEIAPLSFTGVLRIAADISRGLHYLHSQMPSLIHRDLKGPNIFITRRFIDGGGTEEYASRNIVAKLGDFGLSSAVCGPYQLRAQGKMEHINQRWAAPEILEGRNYSVNSDVYSMGLVFWETRYRKIAYHDIRDFLHKLKVEICKGIRPKLSFYDKFDEIIEKCWCSSPSERLTAQQTYSSIRSLSASLAPSLYQHLPPISTTLNNNPNNASHRGRFVKKVNLPQNTLSERSHRVTCLATGEREVWGGCTSGFIFCYFDDDEEEEGGESGGELLLGHATQLSGEGKGTMGVNAIVVDKEELVWVGGENGWLSLWKSVDGGMAGEEVKFRVNLLHRSWKMLMDKAVLNQDSFLKLEFGVVSWKGWSSFLRPGEKESEGVVLLSDLKEVREKKGRWGGVGIVMVEKGGREREFELEGEEEGRKALELFEFALLCSKEKRILKRVGGNSLKGRVRALEIAGGRVWSFDDSPQIREWKATHDLTGKQKGTYPLSCLRSFDFPSLSFNLSQNPFSCFFPVGNEELYVIFKQYGVILERSHSMEGEPEKGGVKLKRVWNIFGKEKEKEERKGGEGEREGEKREGGWDLFDDDERISNQPRREKGDVPEREGERQREEVWCGVYFGLRNEVWVGTSEGGVWRKGEKKLEKKKVEGGVRAMAVVGTQIWCGTTNGEIYRFDAINFTQIHNNDKQKEKEREKNERKEQITSFGVVPGGTRVWSGSLDRSISLWC